MNPMKVLIGHRETTSARLMTYLGSTLARDKQMPVRWKGWALAPNALAK